MNSSKNYHHVCFRFHVRVNSLDSETLNYLKSFGRETNGMMLEAIRPYWMVIAALDTGFAVGEGSKKLAFQSVSALVSRARYLCTTFDLDPAAFGLASSNLPVSSVIGVAASGSIPSKESPTDLAVLGDEDEEEEEDVPRLKFNTAGL